MSHHGRLVDEYAVGLGRSVVEVWEVLEALRLAWGTIGKIPCSEIEDLTDQIPPETLTEIVDLLTEPRSRERRAA